ncbi:hypothetical protein ACOI1C_17230, partial [Bacillus sp. DJP31]|uniref:hypothetical protein n=1 Tax=Bacillus sp. DJP31 TaxID=3409789 RepID=UPI003BB74F93
MKQDISGMKQDISGMKQDINGMKQDINGMKQDISGMKQDISGMKQDISGMQQDISGMQQDISRMQNDIHMLDTRQFELNQMVSSIRDNQLAQREGHDSLVHDVAEMKGEIKSIDKKLENVSSTLDQLVESQERKDKILESLSLRSLEQETDIRELKRIK